MAGRHLAAQSFPLQRIFPLCLASLLPCLSPAFFLSEQTWKSPPLPLTLAGPPLPDTALQKCGDVNPTQETILIHMSQAPLFRSCGRDG